jgi:hypothetical protein
MEMDLLKKEFIGNFYYNELSKAKEDEAKQMKSSKQSQSPSPQGPNVNVRK